jgi:hypothetical protein
MVRPLTFRRATGVAIIGILALTSACSSAESPATTSAAPTPTNTTPSSASPPPCPNVEGGACLGELAAGTSYHTVVFSPPTTYSVGESGWSNYEDTPGNFLLVPPGNDLPGVNAGTSDFIGIYTSIAPATFIHPPDCSTELVPGIAPTPQAMVTWMQRQSAIDVTKPGKADVGGLTGLVTDVSVKPKARLPVCKDGSTTFSVFLLFSGLPPSSLDHGVIEDMTMRLYLLAYRGHLLVIELDDIKSAPGTLDSLTSTVKRLQFAA